MTSSGNKYYHVNLDTKDGNELRNYNIFKYKYKIENIRITI